MNSKIFKLILLICVLSLSYGCTDSDKYVLQKYYKDPNSAAAKLMGGLYAGSIGTFSRLENCQKMKFKVEQDDKKIGYTNSRFVCEKQ
ncbi:hypothetical protein SPBRAN_1614 [uncultured Candidatus Thioglobus sp.]|nr:hypothetical protein SPBRAN_1614 [uncultured Candidatus Thioglobus sp.]